MSSKAVKRNSSIAKVLSIMEVMAESGGKMRLQDISARVSQPASTVLRYLNTLMDHGYADQDGETQRYYLTFKLSRIGDQVYRQLKIRDVVRPFLERLSMTFKESTSLAIEQKMDVVYIDVVDGPDHLLQALQRIGKVAPMHGTGVGKCLLSRRDEKGLDEYIQAKGLHRVTEHTIDNRAHLIEEINKVKQLGYAEDIEECEVGVRCLAAPIRDYTRNTIAAISTSGPIYRMTTEKVKDMRDELVQAAALISEKLGYNDGQNQ